MAEEKAIIDLCSSEEDEKDEDFSEENHCDETEDEETSSDEDDSDWTQDDSTDSDLENDFDENTKANVEDAEDDKVSLLLRAGSDLKAANVKDCKEYLRKNGLRLTGTKPVLIDRIVEHWRIKDGTGLADYPKSSFVINCKGDVCKGDIVLFTQKVHQKFEKMKGSGKIMGRRTVAGKVIKESYGTAKQQHTFTIEVLWCEGIQKLPPLYPLLVKGRNLYRLMTLRQPWANEGDRVKVLSEKHSRGAAARKVMRERKIKLGYVFKDGRLQKPDHMKKPCQAKIRKNKKDENLNQNPSQGHKNPTQLSNMNPPFRPYNSHLNAPPRPYPPPPSHRSHMYAPRPYAPFNVPHSHLPRPNIPPSHSYAYSTQQNQPIQRPPPAFYNGRPASNAMWGQASYNPRPNTHHQSRPYQNNHHASSNSGYNYGVRDLDHFSEMVISQRRQGDNTYKQSQGTHRPYVNHQTYHSNTYNGASQGDTQRQSRDGYTYRPNYR